MRHRRSINNYHLSSLIPFPEFLVASFFSFRAFYPMQVIYFLKLLSHKKGCYDQCYHWASQENLYPGPVLSWKSVQTAAGSLVIWASLLA